MLSYMQLWLLQFILAKFWWLVLRWQVHKIRCCNVFIIKNGNTQHCSCLELGYCIYMNTRSYALWKGDHVFLVDQFFCQVSLELEPSCRCRNIKPKVMVQTVKTLVSITFCGLELNWNHGNYLEFKTDR